MHNCYISSIHIRTYNYFFSIFFKSSRVNVYTSYFQKEYLWIKLEYFLVQIYRFLLRKISHK